MVSYQNQPRGSKTKEPQLGGSQTALYLVLWLAVCLFERAIFEEEAWQSSLQSGIDLAKKIKNPTVRGCQRWLRIY